MDIQLRKKDIWLALLAGEIVAWLSLPTLKNLKVLDILAERGIGLAGFAIFWALLIPASALAGLGFFYFMAKRQNRIGFFQLGKYGVIGVLNTLINAGIYNFLIFITDIAKGLMIDLFFVITFVITVINSFFWNKYWAFEERGAGTIKKEALQFFTVSSIVALINTGLIHFLINVAGAPANLDPKIWANVALVFAIVVAFLGNFFGYKYIVFKK